MRKIADWNSETERWETPSEGMLDIFAEAHSVPFSETLPPSGFMWSGSVFERPMLEPRIVASVYSSWRSTTLSIESPVDLLPSPISSDAEHGPDYARANRGGSGGDDLTTTVFRDLLPTPTRTNVDGNTANNRGELLLPGVAEELLPTPSVAVAEGGQVSRGGDRADEPLLGGIAEQFQLLPTPTAKDEAGSGGSTPADVTLTDAVERTEFGTIENPRHLLPTPVTEPNTGNGHARDLGSEIDMLPTPNATLNGYDADPAAFETRRQAAAERWGNNGLGLPLSIAARTLPADGPEDVTADGETVRWGKYRTAILRAQTVTGRLAPSPTTPDGKGGKRRLSAAFVEWMMMLPEGWVTAVPGIIRREQLKALGNGVVPPEASAATLVLLERHTARLTMRSPAA